MRRRPAILLLFGAFFLGVAFQNCAPSELVFEDIQKSEERAFFDYPYKTAPEFYGNMILFQQESSLVNLAEFTFVGTAAYLANSTTAVNYSIKIVDADKATDNVICAQADGALLAGESTITFNCVTAKVFKTMKIMMTLTAGTASTTIEKIYQR